MKTIFIALAASTTAAVATLPVFSFGEHRAGASYNVQSLIAAGCKTEGAVISCLSSGQRVGGWPAVIQYTIVNRRLSNLLVAGDREALPDVSAAMRTRYGEPCASGTETLVNGLGASFPSRVVTWCFRTGKLRLHHTGLSMRYYKAVYTDEANPEPARQVRPDF